MDQPDASRSEITRGDITRQLGAANDGDPEAMRSVLALLHDRLRAIAHRQLSRESDGHTLESIYPRYSRIVECRFFAGLSIEETADVLALSPATVKRGWVTARAWLNHELQS